MDFTVLIVDDEKEILEILEYFLESEFSCKILKARSGKEAIEILQKENVSLIISDYFMKDGNGGVVYRYNEENGKKPFILVSAGYLGNYPEFKNFAVDDYNNFLPKPFDFNELLNVIKKCLKLN